MCLGASARTANANARRRYAYENEQRERKWMQSISIYNAQKVKFQEDRDNANLAQAGAYTDMQQAMNKERGDALLKYQDLFEKLQKESTYSKITASGQSGKSARRIRTMELSKYGRDVSAIARKVQLNDMELAKKTQEKVGALKAFKDQAFANVAFQPIETPPPPRPVMQTVGAAAFMDALSIGSSIATMGGTSGFGWWGG